MEITLRIDPTGKSVTMLYYDDHPLGKIGSSKKIVRASDVGFDNARQKWVVNEISLDGGIAVKNPVGPGFDRREDAIKYEITWLEKKLAVDPGSIMAMFKCTTTKK